MLYCCVEEIIASDVTLLLMECLFVVCFVFIYMSMFIVPEVTVCRDRDKRASRDERVEEEEIGVEGEGRGGVDGCGDDSDVELMGESRRKTGKPDKAEFLDVGAGVGLNHPHPHAQAHLSNHFAHNNNDISSSNNNNNNNCGNNNIINTDNAGSANGSSNNNNNTSPLGGPLGGSQGGRTPRLVRCNSSNGSNETSRQTIAEIMSQIRWVRVGESGWVSHQSGVRSVGVELGLGQRARERVPLCVHL